MGGRIKTLHPEPGKQGVNILRTKYEKIRDAILSVMAGVDMISFTDLMELVADDLEDAFEGSVSWYVTTVKLDLEARNLIERVPGERPQKLRRVRKK
jgi:hypothetical protein